MHLNRFSQGVDVVSAFQTTYHAAFSVRPRDFQCHFGELAEVLGLQSQRANWIFGVGVETGADKYNLRLNQVSRLVKCLPQRGEIFLSRGSITNRHINGVSQAAPFSGFVGRAGASIEAPAIAV